MDTPNSPSEIGEAVSLPGHDEVAMLITFLAERDAYCPLCQYNLRGLQRPTCPECGCSIALTVGLTEPYLKAWLIVVGFACAGAGLGMLFIILIFAQGFPPSIGFIVIVFYYIGQVPVACVAIGLRRQFLRLSTNAQQSIAGVYGGLSVIVFILMVVTIVAL